jgi:hypothetical protein
MTKITIVAENPGSPNARFRASAEDLESVGTTVGAALGALTDRLDPAEAGTLIVVQKLQPDEFFTAAQRDRLQELLTKRRTAHDSGCDLSQNELKELEQLVDAELDGATRRAAAMVRELQS